MTQTEKEKLVTLYSVDGYLYNSFIIDQTLGAPYI